MRLLPAAGRAFLDLLWPPVCPACGRVTWDGTGLCPACLEALPSPRRRCRRCGRATGPVGAVSSCVGCADEDLRLEGVVAAWPYAGTARELVLALKFRRRLAAAGPLVAGMADALLQQCVPGDLLVALALGARRRRERGYDQAALLAAGLARRLDLPLAPGALWRRRETPPQTGLGRRRRRTSPRGAFAADRARVEGHSVLLVDDVLTTGGTARAAAVALRRAGARAVVAVVACRAEAGTVCDGGILPP